MKIKPGPVAGLIIGSAIIWAAVIIGCSSALSGTDCYDKIQFILSGGVLAHIILIWGPMAMVFRKLKTRKEDDLKE